MILPGTARLRLRLISESDAPFILQLVNDPQWLLHIGDRAVHSLDDARRYIRTGMLAMYERFGFGLYVVELKSGTVPIGLCGLLKRDYLDAMDIGFAYLPQHRGQGYALEAAEAVIQYARASLGATRLAAITSRTNDASARLLGKLGFRLVGDLCVAEEGESLRLYRADFREAAEPPAAARDD